MIVVIWDRGGSDHTLVRLRLSQETCALVLTLYIRWLEKVIENSGNSHLVAKPNSPGDFSVTSATGIQENKDGPSHCSEML